VSVCKDPGKAGLAGYTSIHTSQGTAAIHGRLRGTFGDGLGKSEFTVH
jgi:hypothetical protein